MGGSMMGMGMEVERWRGGVGPRWWRRFLILSASFNVEMGDVRGMKHEA